MLCLIAGDLHTLHIHGELICYVITANGGVNQFSTVGCVLIPCCWSHQYQGALLGL